MKKLILMSLLIVAQGALAVPISGAGFAGGSGGDASCQSVNADQKVKQWAPMVEEVLNDQSGCAGQAVSALQNQSVPKMDEFCPASGDPKARFCAITLATMEIESSGDPQSTGDGGKSQGLLQSTSGDGGHQECQGDQKDPKTGLKCGMCLLFDGIKKANVFFEGQKGAAEFFGPYREGNAAHEKQLTALKKACGGGGGSPGGGGSAGAIANKQPAETPDRGIASVPNP